MIDYLLDSGFLYASLDNSDEHHESVKAITNIIRGNIILPIPAITETAYFLARNQSVKALARFTESLAVTKFQLEVPTTEYYKRAAEIIRKYNDAKYLFC